MTPDEENALLHEFKRIDRMIEHQRRREAELSNWPVIIVGMAGAAIFAAGMLFGTLFVKLF